MAELPASPPAAAPMPVRTVHTTSFPPLLRQLGISLLVSTYQAVSGAGAKALSERYSTRQFESAMDDVLKFLDASGVRR